MLFLLKSHVKGYTRSDGVYVKDHETKVAKKPAASKWPGWDTKPSKITSIKQISAKIGGKQPKSSDFSHEEHSSLFFRFKPKHYPNAITHPQKDDKGNEFKINEPTSPSDKSSWSDPGQAAVFVPGGEVPQSLNGVGFSPWHGSPTTLQGWAHVEGQMQDLDEPDLETGLKDPAAGVIVEEPDGRIWLVSPSNGFAGYTTTFPKGHADDGLSLQASAIKEAFEESGLQVEITGLYGDIERSQTVTRYYRARRVGGTPADMGWETQAVRLVPACDVHSAVNQAIDRQVANMAGILPTGNK